MFLDNYNQERSWSWTIAGEMFEPDESGVKVFSLAGYRDQPAVMKELEEKVVGLGGEVAPGAWSERTTHVLVNKFSEFPEKVMLGLVCGVWVVTRRYVDNSSHRGAWADVRVGRGQSGM